MSKAIATLRDNTTPGWLDAIPVTERLSVAYDVDASYFIGRQIEEDNLTLINDAVTSAFTIVGYREVENIL